MVYAGIDIGGSAIKSGLIDAQGEILGHIVSPVSKTNSTPRAIMDQVVYNLRELAQKHGLSFEQIEGVGIGFPGLVDSSRQMVRACVNLRDWHNVPVTELLQNRISNCPKIVIANDANAAAYGEYMRLSKKRNKLYHMALVTIGTGVGAGVVLRGGVFDGGTGLAGEVGHMIVRANGRKCGCGQYGCLEKYASVTAMVDSATEMVERGVETSLTEVINDPSRHITARDIFKAAQAQDFAAQRIIDSMAEFVAIGCVNLCRVVDLQAIVLGGGITGAGEELLRPLRAAFKVQNWALPEAPTPEIMLSQLGNDAGFVGAAYLAKADEKEIETF